jgi:putative PIN family toxin of toxin-antitoxin system
MIPRVVLDTNVVVSALLKPHGLEDQVFRLALAGRLLLCVSPEVLAEYGRVLSSPKFKFKPEEVATALRQLEKAGSLFHPAQTLRISAHEPDNRFYECADAAQAAFLITGNLKHFKKDYQATKVVNARKLLDLLATGQIYICV